MKKIKNYAGLFIKGILYIYLPIIILLYIAYEFILKRDIVFSLERDLSYIVYIFLIGIWAVVTYRDKIVSRKTEDFASLKKLVAEGEWEIIEEDGSRLIVKPKFNFPFRLLIDDRVQIDYSEGKVTIRGPRYYVDNMVRDIDGRPSFWLKKSESVAAIFVILSFVSVPISLELGIPWEITKIRHSSFVEDIPVIDIDSADIIGNSVQNINNYGQGVENEDYIFYVERDLNLVRVNKDYTNKTYIIEKSSGSNISRLNIAGDWIFYTSGKNLNRIRTDGSEEQTIYKSSYALDLHMKDKWLYFINLSDNSSVYKIDINGRNLEKFLEGNVSDIAIYDDEMIVSVYDEEDPYIERVGLDPDKREVELEVLADKLVSWDGYYYYIGQGYKLYRNKIEGIKEPEVIVDDKVSSYVITENGIFYSLHAEDVGYPGEGLFKTSLDASVNRLILDEVMVGGFTKFEDHIIFHSADESYDSQTKKLNIFTDQIELMR